LEGGASMTMPAVRAHAGNAPIANAPAWITCHGSTRSVVEGVVICPHGWFMPWARCLGCRYLEEAEDDRDRERGCSCEPTLTTADDHSALPLESWAELVIELL
jgi:hypothetical protein